MFLYSKEAVRRCLSKQVFLKISQQSKEKICVEFLFNIFAGLKICNFIKKGTLAQVFSCEFGKLLRTPPGECFCILKCYVALDLVLLVLKLYPIQVVVSLPQLIKLTMNQILLLFLCNLCSIFSYFGGVLVTNFFSLLLIDIFWLFSKL